MQNNLDAKHCCVSCSSNLGSVLCCHSFRQRESPVRPDIRKGEHSEDRIRKIFDQVTSRVYLSEAWFHIYPKRQNYRLDEMILEDSPYACLASVAAPVVSANTPPIHHHCVANSEEKVESS